MDNNLVDQRAARRFLTERVRNDWDWPTLPEYWSASDEEVRGISEFRERYYGESATESDPEPEPESISPYKFDSPDSVGDAVELKSHNRKRRRRAALESEMDWNTGLACFVGRRDAWTGAAAVEKYGTNRPPKSDQVLDDSSSGDTGSGTPDTSVVAAKLQNEENIKVGNDVPTSNNHPYEPRVPVPQRLLADNSIRKSVTPKVYPDIYSKIVVSGRSPAVPINLSDMTRALVVGWKESGEWPPKAAPLDPLVGRKKPDVHATNADGEFLSHHPHMKRGMDSVKRILHLNGHHHEHGPVGHTG